MVVHNRKIHIGFLLFILPVMVQVQGFNNDLVSKEELPGRTESNRSVEVIQETITGTVTDEQSGQTLPGVNILVKGTSTGTSTNADGQFELTVPSLQDTLVISFVGYQTQEVPIQGRTEIDVTLQSQAITGEEMVVVGYGTQQESDLTGSITRANPSDFEELPNTNIMESLKGTVPGLNIGMTDAAGESPDLRIRGYSTLSTGASANEPLLVVDGSIYRGNISDLNPGNIEAVDVLKGISASAVYGSQASNGVIIITTKGGTQASSKPIFSYSAKLTRKTPNEHALEPMNGSGWEQFLRDVHWQDSRIAPNYIEENPDYSIASDLRTINVAEGYEAGIDNDWYDQFTANGYQSSHDLSIQGRNEDLGYFASAGYIDEQGYIENDQFRRYNFRLNLDYDITDWMNLTTETFLTSSDYSGIEPGGVFVIPPFAPINDEQGEYILRPATAANPNPYLVLQGDDADNRLNLLGNVHLDLELPFIRGLVYNLDYSYNYRTRNHDEFNPYAANYTGSGFKNSYINRVWSLDNVIKYKRDFKTTHEIDLTLLYGIEELIDESTVASAQDFSSSLLGYNKLELGDPTLNTINTGKSTESSLYQMARLNYSYLDRYLLTGTIRRDGFSGFGPNKKIGLFPSMALGWILSQESFFRDNLEWVNFFKIRGSYGTAGRRAVGRYQTKAGVNRVTNYIFGDGGEPALGQYITSMSNSNLGWEETTGINLGVDFEVLQSRLRGNFEYYNNNTKNILYDIQLPRITGFGSIPKNISKVHNYGIEFSLTGDVIRTNDLNWQATFSFSRDRNEIKELIGQGDLVANKLFIGEPQRVIYDYQKIGMWQLEDQQAGEIPDGFYPGTYKIADLNNDGNYSASDDRKILGYRDPSYRFNIVNRVNYKRFSLYFIINSIQGGDNYYYGDSSPYINASWYKLDQLEYLNVAKGAWDYWTPDNPDAKYRRLDLPSSFASQGNGEGIHPYEQRNFIRLQDISLSYTFGQNLIENLNLKNLKIYISGKNLFTLTDWSGWDPETGFGLNPNGRPIMRNYTAGINIKF